ncbi:MAG: class I SAM-dependent RNA methyltransferase [Alphaproteobacteria bacterium]
MCGFLSYNRYIMNDNKCKYFNVCGGCQIMEENFDTYVDIKTKKFLESLKSKNIVAENILPVATFPTGIRRRANLKIDYGCNVGFYKRASNDVVGIKSCRMLVPEINRIIPYLPILFKSFVKRSDGSIFITKVSNGLTMHFENINISPLDLSKIKGFAEKLGIIRVSNAREIIYSSEIPFVEFGGVKVPYPINSFLQPSLEGENKIVEVVKEFIGGAKVGKMADLFCGLGLFSFYLRNNASDVYAFDCNDEAIKEINKVAKQNNFNIKAKCVDLFSKPLRVEKLNEFDLIILDPPRDGAKNQILEIAKSDVKKVIYVSCNPLTFVNDAEILQKAGYKIGTIQPIDQFSYTNHIELVSFFFK